MQRYLLPLSIFALALAIALPSLVRPAAAEAPRVADCVALVGMTNQGIAKQYQEQMSTWLAAGKTDFVTTPNGLCAY